jgi:cephalosporin-C deacetylase-like acetyl esterase
LPAGVLAAFNQMKGPKETEVMSESDHHGTDNAQAQYFKRSEEWLRAMVKGEGVPPPQK